MDNANIRGFDHYFKTHMSEVDGRATGGKGIPHEVLELDTERQAVAVKVSAKNHITVCNVYIPPHFNIAQSDFDNLVKKLPAPFILEILMLMVIYGVVLHLIVLEIRLSTF